MLAGQVQGSSGGTGRLAHPTFSTEKQQAEPLFLQKPRHYCFFHANPYF